MTAMRYVGGGAWAPGVPARDLSAEEWEQYREIVGRVEAASGVQLYAAVTPAPTSEIVTAAPTETARKRGG